VHGGGAEGGPDQLSPKLTRQDPRGATSYAAAVRAFKVS
jgi:hypothetical protein